MLQGDSLLEITDELILTAGPMITERELFSVIDATLHGWNTKHSDYLHKLSAQFQTFFNVKNALCLSSCTGSLHLALKSLNLSPGDEVIVPEMTWIATAAAVCYLGAKPVFADIDARTWVIDPKSIESLITSKTKAIIPVHIYGQVANMAAICDLAKTYNLFVVEDAAAAIGAKYAGQKVGTWGDLGCFSFQGAKTLVTGEGGMLISNNDELFSKAQFFNNHCRDLENPFQNTDIGFKYKMANLLAAFATGQMENIEIILSKKKQIFTWYKERLSQYPEIQLNEETINSESMYWMTSIVLDKSIQKGRDVFMQELKLLNIDTRPMFYPLSSMPMFESNFANMVAYDVPLRGINLPSGLMLTEDEVDYVCEGVLKLLGRKKNILLKGNLLQKAEVHSYIDSLKRDKKTCPELSFEFADTRFTMSSVNFQDLDDKELVHKLSVWRKEVQEWFPSITQITDEGTRSWLDHAVLKNKNRILFMLEDEDGKQIAHLGLSKFDYVNNFCELDNIVRGESSYPGAMKVACEALINFASKKLGIQDFYLRVFADNFKAVKLYEAIGFVVIQSIPMSRRTNSDETVEWVELIGNYYKQAERYLLVMKLKD